MANPRDILSPEDYSNYRNFRAVSVLFVLIGVMGIIGGLVHAAGQVSDTNSDSHPAIGVFISIVGLASCTGGVAALCGSRRLAPLVFVIAALYIFAFPIGTLLSLVMFKGLWRYLGSVERVKAAASEGT